jgi:hypothetical protein
MNITSGMANVYSKLFRRSDTARDDYLSCEEFMVKQILQELHTKNFLTPDLAMSTGNKLVGYKLALNDLRQQYELAKKIVNK